MDLKYPKNNVSLIRCKSLNTNKLTLASKGYSPKSQYFYLTLDQENNTATLRKINTFYLFENKFDYLEGKIDKQKDGLQFRKIESREEIEHLKKNINYKIRNLENEKYKCLKYVDKSNDIVEEFKCLKIEERAVNNGTQNHVEILKRITNSLKKAVVVNIKDLEVLYKDKRAIRTVLSKNAFYFNGRYVLNGSFYSEDLLPTREKILEIIRKKGFIFMSDIEKDIFLIRELCFKDENSPKYILKGYHEEEDVDIVQSSTSADNIVFNIIKERYFCNLNDIKVNCSLDLYTIKNILFKENFISVGDNIYTVVDPEETHSELKDEIIRLIKNKKSYRKGEINTAISNMSEALKIDTTTILNYIEKVFVNKRGVWSVKETFN